MNSKKPQYNQGLITIPLENGQSLEVTPQECWRLTEETSAYLFENYGSFDSVPMRVIEKNNKRFNVAITEHVPFWKKVDKGRWEPHTFEIFDDFLSADHICLDIGGWIGPTALYAAQLAKHVYAFEPDPLAYQELEVNVNLNKLAEWSSRLSIYNTAIAAHSGTIRLGSRKRGGDSMSSVLFADRSTSWEIQAITLQQFIEDKQLQHEKLFIKMDIEGGEYELIPSLKQLLSQYNVDLYLSVHPFYLEESQVGGQVQEKENSLFKRISQRLAFVKYQVKLLRSLPFKYLYHINGQQLRPYKQILKAIVTGDFTHEIVATNTQWDKS
ncbi:MAG: FkbM family methyltransferase [uncultured Thiotrichaceae bacterium]|uniref:FkbM family methyltransferase n=1 Tax=uncultured Thiotrichaceae bacterium TaxID=298394 RepID=A0A6S6T5R0_9GAMM|nr:MAG: FkbM family methyltransferase [uncultured Thiotrichaceae bacterium]